MTTVWAVLTKLRTPTSFYASERCARRIVERFNADPFTAPGEPDPDAPYTAEAFPREAIGNWNVRSDAEADASERKVLADAKHAEVAYDLQARAELHKAYDHLTEALYLSADGSHLESTVRAMRKLAKEVLGE